MAKRPDSTSSLRLLKAFSHALNHRVRTPLSTIANDLYYFSTLLPPGECERALRKCNEIGEILSIGMIPEVIEAPQAIDLCALVEELCATSGVRIVPQLPETPITITTHDTALRALISRLHTIAAQCIETPHAITVTRSPVTLCINGKSALLAESQKGEYRSLTELLCEEMKLDYSEAVLIDALVESLGGEIVVQDTGKELTITVTL